MLSNALNHAQIRAVMHERERESRAAHLRVAATRARRERRRRARATGQLSAVRWLRRLVAAAR